MTVSAVGTPASPTATTASNSPSVTGTWGSGQSRTANDLLVAAVTAYGTTTAVLGSAPSGWVLASATIANGTTITAHYTKTAAGSDSAPSFSATMTGTAGDAQIAVVLHEFSDSSGNTPVLVSTGLAVGTSGTITAATDIEVPVSGCLAVASAMCSRGTTSATTTWTTPSGWTLAGDQTASARSQMASYYSSSAPSSGSAASCLFTHSRTSTEQAASIVLIAPAGTTPGPMVVQHVGDYAGAATDSGSFAAPNVAGNCLVALVSQGTASTDQDLTGITSGGSADNWGSLKYNTVGNIFDMSVWADPDCAGGSATWEVSGETSNTNQLFVDMYEASGLATTLAGLLDQSAHYAVDGTGDTWTSDATGTTSQASEIAFGFMSGYNLAVTATTITGPSSPWVNEGQIIPSTGVFQQSGHQIASATAAFTYSGTSNMTGSNNYYGATVVTFKAAAVTGSAGGTATATLTPAGRKGASSSPGITATGTLTPSGKKNASSAQNITATGTLTPAGRKHASGSSAITAAGAVTPAGAKGAFSAATVTASGTLTAAGTKSATGPATLTATTTLTAAGSKSASNTAALTATAATTPAGLKAATGPSSVSATAAITAAGTTSPAFTSTIAATAALTPAGTKGATGVAAASATGSPAGAGLKNASNAAALTATGTLIPAGVRNATGSSSISATGATTPGGGSAPVSGSATVTGAASLTPAGFKAATGSATISATGSLAGASAKAATGPSSISGTGALSATGAPASEGDTYYGLFTRGYLQYTDLATGETLVAVQGRTYHMVVASGWTGLSVPPTDGWWTGPPGDGGDMGMEDALEELREPPPPIDYEAIRFTTPKMPTLPLTRPSRRTPVRLPKW